MRLDGKSTRFIERANMRIPLHVVYRESADEEWIEKTWTEQITICGVGFVLSRPVEPRRLIRLQMPMPKKYRLFDLSKDYYSVWALIRYVRLIEPVSPNQIRLAVGTALIGDEPPASFFQEPKTLYDLKPVLQRQSFWDVRELPRRSGPFFQPYEERQEIEMRVNLKTVDELGNLAEKVEARTLNISQSGAAVVVEAAKLKTGRPSYVLIEHEEKNIKLLGAVRNVRFEDPADTMRLHLEFISGKWPL